MLNVVLFSDVDEPGLMPSLQRGAAWVEGKTGRSCPVTLRRAPALPRPADGTATHGASGTDWYGPAVRAVVDELRLPPGQYVCLVRGAGGFAGSNLPRPGYGIAVLGDWCLDAVARGTFGPDVAEWVRAFGAQSQIGALLHEWGHTFGANHPPEGTDGNGLLMGAWWGWPNVSLPREVDWQRVLPPMDGQGATPEPREGWWTRMGRVVKRTVGGR